MISFPSLDGLSLECRVWVQELLAAQSKSFLIEHHYFEQEFLDAIKIPVSEYIESHRVMSWINQQPQEATNLQLKMNCIETPLGQMLAVFSQKGLSLLEFVGQKGLLHELGMLKKSLGGRFVWQKMEQADQLQHELNEYFDGRLKEFSIQLEPVGTEFQQRVWQELLAIDYGTTCSYKEQAERLGNSRAVRAVARANGQNKISILIPCHRVIGSDGTLTGYAGGLNRKQALLTLEYQEPVQTALFN